MLLAILKCHFKFFFISQNKNFILNITILKYSHQTHNSNIPIYLQMSQTNGAI